MASLPSPPIDCCVALGAELRGETPLPRDWRPLLARSSLLPSRPRLHVVLRYLNAAFMNGVLLASAIPDVQYHGTWCIYLTHWTLLVVCAHLTLAAGGAVAGHWSLARGEPPPEAHPLWLSLLWKMQAIALPCSLLVVVLFWGLLAPGDPSVATLPINYFVHGANFLAMAADWGLSSAPYPYRYAWSSFFVYAVLYVLFTIVYFLSGGKNEYHQRWVYTVLYWGSRSSASSAGFLVGVIVFLIVPALGLLAYCAVFTRRSRWGGERFPWGRPACGPPARGAVVPRLLPLLAAHPSLRHLPGLAVFLLAAALGGATGSGTTSHRAGYWHYREDHSAARVPFISDMGVDWPGYFIFASLLSAGAAVTAAVFRLLYEGMDGLLARADAAQGVFVYPSDDPGRSQPPARHAELDAPLQAPEMWAGERAAPPLAGGPPLPRLLGCAATPRARHCCCCCCWQGLRQQGHSAYVVGMLSSFSLVVVGWASAGLAIEVHSLAAAMLFVGMYVHLCLFARIQAARVRIQAACAAQEEAAAAAGAARAATPRAESLSASAAWKALLGWAVPVLAILAIAITLLASGRYAVAVWSGYLSPVLEWGYAGVMGLYVLSLVWELGECAREAAVTMAAEEAAAAAVEKLEAGSACGG